jgi:1-deoxy-D-xylulose-5-phosphate synthase
MVVMAPSDENELRRMLVTALNHKGPIALRYPRSKGTGVDMTSSPEPLPVGKGRILAEGDDILIFAIGRTVNDAMEARERLFEKGIHATIVDSRFVKPIDSDLIVQLAEKIPRIITIEENVIQGGFGSAVLECLNDAGIAGFSLTRMGIPDTFVEHGDQDLLRSKYGIDAGSISDTALKILGHAGEKTKTA